MPTVNGRMIKLNTERLRNKRSMIVSGISESKKGSILGFEVGHIQTCEREKKEFHRDDFDKVVETV